MSERATKAKRSNGRARLPVRDDLFDSLWHEIMGRVEEMIEARALTMGTVVGRDGEAVRVRIDDEDEDRTIGFGRALGVAYDVGDRVPVARTAAGDPLVLPPSGKGTDQRVRNPQLDTDAVNGRTLAGRSVSSGHLESSLENKVNNAMSESAATAKFATNNRLNDTISAYNANFRDVWDRLDKLEKRVFK